MKKGNEKPGVMIYFEILEAFPLLSNAEKGILFESILQYAKDGRVPDLKGRRNVSMVWHLTKPHLDADDARYRNVTARRQYAAYVRWSRKKEQEVLDYDDWVKSGGLQSKQTYLDADDAFV